MLGSTANPSVVLGAVGLAHGWRAGLDLQGERGVQRLAKPLQASLCQECRTPPSRSGQELRSAVWRRAVGSLNFDGGWPSV
jgi:hypothetical protein